MFLTRYLTADNIKETFILRAGVHQDFTTSLNSANISPCFDCFTVVMEQIFRNLSKSYESMGI